MVGARSGSILTNEVFESTRSFAAALHPLSGVSQSLNCRNTRSSVSTSGLCRINSFCSSARVHSDEVSTAV